MKAKQMPHPIPYQGSKRNLAESILAYFPTVIETLYEPFAGSAAITMAAAARGIGKKYHINDLNRALMELWRAIIETPESIASQYCCLWDGQKGNPQLFYREVREEFNRTGSPDMFLYLLARCAKASVRYNSNGEFNQSPDNRRQGMKPETMRTQIYGASYYLKDKTDISSIDYREILEMAKPCDLVYMDPPYQGVCGNRDKRYFQSIAFDDFVESLAMLNKNGIRYIVSYDGRTGDKAFGESLPKRLGLSLIELNAGRSSQATLLGRNDETVESLYLSRRLVEELKSVAHRFENRQPCLMI